jgi:hypothetical protein
MPQLDFDGANSKISADKIQGQSGTTVTIPAGHSLVGDGSGLTSLPAANLTGTVADARFPATLPASSGANLTSLPAANLTGNLPAIDGSSLTGITTGKVLQVVSVAIESGSTYVNTLDDSDVLQTLSITPSSTSSKILVLCSLSMEKSGSGYATFALFRGAARRNSFGNNFGYALANNVRGHMSATFLDSPNSSSSVTYNIMPNGVASGGSTTWYQHASTLTLIEVGA